MGVAPKFLSRIGAITAILLCHVSSAVTAAAPESSIHAEIAGESFTVFSHRRDACEPSDIPDAPARAMRTTDGMVRILAAGSINRALIGRDALHLHHDCAIVFRGAESDDPADFDDRGWVASTFTPDGRTVFGLIHNEFQANRRPWLCPSRVYMECWYNAITAVVSHDGGRSFVHLGKPPSLVAALPLRFDQTRGRHAGFFSPSNIVAWHGAYFFFANTTGPGPQPSGNCLFRTQTLEDPSSWRGWTGSGFTGQTLDPYTDGADPSRVICRPVAPEHLRWPSASLAFHKRSREWLMVMMSPAGIVVSTSRDLLLWSEPALLMAGQLPSRFACGGPGVFAYPALIDPESPDGNFAALSDEAQLFLTRFDVHDCKIGMDRDLIRIPVRIEAAR